MSLDYEKQQIQVKNQKFYRKVREESVDAIFWDPVKFFSQRMGAINIRIKEKYFKRKR